MAGVLCNFFCVEPCRAVLRCCEVTCDCIGNACNGLCDCCIDICRAIDQCCIQCTDLFFKPFACCLLLSEILNIASIVYGIYGLVESKNDCGHPLVALSIATIFAAVINGIFSYYLFITMNNEEMLQRFQNSQHITSRAYDFFCQDYWFAGYICIAVGIMVLAAIGISMGSSCNSPLGSSLFVISILQWVYLGTGLLILLSYVCVEALRKASREWWCYLLPCFWPCLCLGLCINCAEKEEQHRQANLPKYDKKPPNENKITRDTSYPHDPSEHQPMIHNPSNTQNYATVPQQPYNPNYDPNYNPGNNTSYPSSQNPPINPNLNPGTLVIYDNNNNNIDNTSAIKSPVNNTTDNNTGTIANTTGQVKEYAKDKGLQALSWVTTKVSNLNEKYNNQEGKPQ